MEVFSVKPVLFEKDDTNYDHNGIAVLYDSVSCTVTEEYNGVFDMELEYPVDGEWFNEIKEERQILAKPNDVDDPHAFRIYEVTKDLDTGVMLVKATSVTDDLGGNLIPHVSVTNLTAQQALTEMKNNLIEPTVFDFVSDIDTRSSTEWTRINPLQAIVGTDGSLVDFWGGDIKRTNNTIYLYSRRGTDHVTVIRPGKNVDGFNMVVSTKGIITKILPYYTYTPEPIPSYHMVDDGNGNMVKETMYSPTGSDTRNKNL
jgi:phage minor structural protein